MTAKVTRKIIKIHYIFQYVSMSIIGGARMVTFLGYMSDVESGGRTIFPAIGLTIKPVKGDALFWLTTKDNLNFDSQMYHAGCPVLYGNKWVFTKWIYSDDQMWNYPCMVENGNSKKQRGSNFPIFTNELKRRNLFTGLGIL